MIDNFFTAIMTLLLLMMIPYCIRILKGPTLFDRIVGLNGVGTKVAVGLVIVGLMYNRTAMFIDLAISLFLLNLFTSLLIARYVRDRKKIPR